MSFTLRHALKGLCPLDKYLAASAGVSLLLGLGHAYCTDQGLSLLCKGSELANSVFRATLLAQFPEVRANQALTALTHPLSALTTKAFALYSGKPIADLPSQLLASYLIAQRSQRQMALSQNHLVHTLHLFNALGAAFSTYRCCSLNPETEEAIKLRLQQQEAERKAMEERWRAERKEDPVTLAEQAKLEEAKAHYAQEIGATDKKLKHLYDKLLKEMEETELHMRQEAESHRAQEEEASERLEEQITGVKRCPLPDAQLLGGLSDIARAADKTLKPTCASHAKMILSASFDEGRWKKEKCSYVKNLYRQMGVKTHPDHHKDPLAPAAFIAIAAAKLKLCPT